MNSFKRILGILLLVTSLAGIVISLAGGYLVLTYRKPAGELAARSLDQAGITLKTTEEGMASAADSLDRTILLLDSIQDTTREAGRTLSETDPLFVSMAVVVGEDLPAVIGSTQTSLDTAGDTALVIDRMLYALDAISFISGVNYDPEVTLAESISQVSESLDELSPNFQSLEEGILVANDNLQLVGEDLMELETELGQVQEPLRGVRDSLVQYQQLSGKMLEKVEKFSLDPVRLVNWVSLGAALFLLWLLVTQAALLLWGWEMTGFSSAEAGDERPDSAPGD
ncbi:MAG: hypothetical protein U5K99_04370 [Anaerolineales bacterium]|nr:hypothetical protein [Anaerolineales bacterium]